MARKKIPKQEVCCEACGKIFYRYPSQISKHNFCSRKCAKVFTSSRMSNFNRQENPMNTPDGWSKEQREAVRQREQKRMGPCSPETYPKEHGKHEHRRVAEQMLGRALNPGEVVHHIDRDKHNNDPRNLMVFSNQAEHRKWHAKHDKGVV